ncbi:MAG: hypothetical protein D6803_05685 [Anaerolineae bacterium]|nr:MAG: hypothetical protein D6803_05685 [Anaerolineae bacterium]
MKELQRLPQPAEPLLLDLPAQTEESADEMPVFVQAAETDEPVETGVQVIEQLIARIQEL